MTRTAWASALLLFVAGVGIRVSNAVFYPTAWGFDAKFNWEYIELLRESWALRAPDVAWATSHPPLYYYLAGAVDLLAGYPDPVVAVALIRGLGVVAGLASIALAVRLVQRIDPGNTRRALFAAALLLFLPAHIYMSAMLNEEILVAAFTSLALFLTAGAVLEPADARHEGREYWRAAAIGAAAGLAWLTKLTGVLALVTALLTLVWLGWKRGENGAALRRIAVLCAVAFVTGGWYYANNLLQYGYLYPFAMPAHELMFQMPPGQRGLLDYLYLPLSTWTDPQLLNPDLLRSVWGSTYATVWYDGHRFFLPRSGLGQQVWGTRLMLLALLPTLACLAGAFRALRQLMRENVQVPLLVLTVLTGAGYVLFTWRNPWFASVKGSYLLGLSLPFAVWASDALDRWSRLPLARGLLVWLLFGALVVGVAAVFSYGLILRKAEVPGLPWVPLGAA